MGKSIAGLVLFSFLLFVSGCGAGKPAATPPGATPPVAKAAGAKPEKKKRTASKDIPDAAATDKDKELATKLMADGGRWTETTTDEDGNAAEYMVIYLPAGILNFKYSDGTDSGTWEVRDGYLIYTMDGVKTADKIKEVTEKQFLYIDHETNKVVISDKVKD